MQSSQLKGTAKVVSNGGIMAVSVQTGLEQLLFRVTLVYDCMA